MSKASFLLLYLVFLVPTYVLPYFGSNSLFAQTASTLFFGAPLGIAWSILHGGALIACSHIAATRGRVIGSKTSMEFMVVAAALFDLVPLLNMIPLVPTIIHAVVLGKGLSGPDEYPDGSAPRGLAAHPYMVLLGVVLFTFAFAGYMTYQAAQKAATQKSSVSSRVVSREYNGTSPSQNKDVGRQTPPRNSEESHDARDGSGESPKAYPFGNPYEKIAASPSLRQAPAEAASGGYAAQQTFAKTESELMAEKRAEADAKKAEQLAKVQKLNAYLETPEAAGLALKYMESYIGYVAAGDPFGAVGLFGADRAKTDHLIAWAQENKGVASAKYGPVQLIKSKDALKPNKLRISAVVSAVRIIAGSPFTYTTQFDVTLSEDGTKFVVAPRW